MLRCPAKSDVHWTLTVTKYPPPTMTPTRPVDGAVQIVPKLVTGDPEYSVLNSVLVDVVIDWLVCGLRE